jgi:hypothetical protein
MNFNWFGPSKEEETYLYFNRIIDVDQHLNSSLDDSLYQMNSYLAPEETILTKNSFGIINLISDVGGLMYLVFILSTWIISPFAKYSFIQEMTPLIQV